MCLHGCNHSQEGGRRDAPAGAARSESLMPENKLIGQVGLGNMGAAVASRLVRYGRVLGFDLGEEQRENAARLGVEVAGDLAGVAEAGVIVLSLPSPKASLAVARELSGLLAPGAIVIETSTVNPGDMRDLQAVLR